MQATIKKHLYEILLAIKKIQDFTGNHEFLTYSKDELLQAAVERKFEIIGEALSRIRKIDPTIVKNISEYRRIINFRNVLSHGYDIVDHEIVWDAIINHLPKLKDEVQKLMQ